MKEIIFASVEFLLYTKFKALVIKKKVMVITLTQLHLNIYFWILYI